MKIWEAAHKSLGELEEPTHLRDLRAHIESNGYFKFGAESPETALGVALSRRAVGVEIGRAADEKLFFRAGPATYGLAEWLSDTDRKSLALEEEVDEAVREVELDTTLFLEQQWHDWLFKNLQSNGLQALGFGYLELYDPDNQNSVSGKYNTGVVGELDMLLKTPDGDLLVIELKRQADDQTIGQICRYFGYVKQALCPEGKSVYGLILGQQISDRLKYALSVVDPKIEARQISMDVTIAPVDSVLEGCAMSPEASRILSVFKARGLALGDLIHFTDFGDAIVWEDAAVKDPATAAALQELIDGKYVVEHNAGLELTTRGEKYAYSPDA